MMSVSDKTRYSSGTKPRENLSQTPKDVSVTTKALLEQDDYVRSEEVEQLIKKAAKAFLKLQK